MSRRSPTLASLLALSTMFGPTICLGSSFTTLCNFSAPNNGTGLPSGPNGPLYYKKGTLIGVSNGGGAYNAGTIFTFNINSKKLAIDYSFKNASDGENPNYLLVDGDTYYGTSVGTTTGGTVFKFNPTTSTLTTLHVFAGGSDGVLPEGIVKVGNFLYGTTKQGGSGGAGTIFAVNATTGQETVIHAFTGGTDGGDPVVGLTVGDGYLFGTTYSGGAYSSGTIFVVDLSTGTASTIYSFGSDLGGVEPAARLIYQRGILYGTTSSCSSSCSGTAFAANLVNGAFTTLFSFTGSSSNGESFAPRQVLYTKGTLYIATVGGGPYNAGTLASVVAAGGGFSQLYNFDWNGGYVYPEGLIVGGSSIFGLTINGGLSGYGTLFRYTP